MSMNVSEQVLRRLREVIALLLWEAGAVKADLKEPFKLVSGNYSPIYVDRRRVISDPVFMRFFACVAGAIRRWAGIRADVVAGGETAGIPFASFVAHSLSLPMVYVRKAKKDHGLSNLVEGHIPQGAEVLLVEDLITDGGSKVRFIDAIGAAGGKVADVFVLFDRLQGGSETMAEIGTRLHSATDMDVLLAVAEAELLLPEGHVGAIRTYLRSPREWHEGRGLTFRE